MLKQAVQIIFSLLIITLLTITGLNLAMAAPPLQGQAGQQGQDQTGQIEQTGQVTPTEQVTGTGQLTETGQMDQTGQMTPTEQMTGTGQLTETGQMGQATMVEGCAQTYVVQQGDTLSQIAMQLLGSFASYTAIVEATNNAPAASGVTPIDDPGVIAPGQTLCIPATTDQQGQVTPTGQVTSTGQTGQQFGAMTVAGQQLNVGQNQGVLVIENLTGQDMIFDIAQPSPATTYLGPNERRAFVLEVINEMYVLNAHQPGGDLVSAPGSARITPGGIVWITCYDNGQCSNIAAPQNIQSQFTNQ